MNLFAVSFFSMEAFGGFLLFMIIGAGIAVRKLSRADKDGKVRGALQSGIVGLIKRKLGG